MESQRKFLHLLKMRGALSTPAISRALEITTEATRQMMRKLAEEGLVSRTSRASGVGRPKSVWQLTEQGNDLFPDTHGELAVQLIEQVRELFGEEGINQLVSAREQHTRTFYQQKVGQEATLQCKVKILTQLRQEEGYMAEWEKIDEGFLLLENHCPICAAASTCQRFCQAEINTFRAVLGPDVSVERLEHIVSGARRCAYRITTEKQ